MTRDEAFKLGIDPLANNSVDSSGSPKPVGRIRNKRGQYESIDVMHNRANTGTDLRKNNGSLTAGN